MTLTRSCALFLALCAISSLTAFMIGRPDYWWALALLLGSAAAWYLTQIDPLKGLSLAAMALRAALIVLYGMALDSGITFLARYRDRWPKDRKQLEEWE